METPEKMKRRSRYPNGIKRYNARHLGHFPSGAIKFGQA
jgi:hypothetical protein